jgi:hypothetical protein
VSENGFPWDDRLTQEERALVARCLRDVVRSRAGLATLGWELDFESFVKMDGERAIEYLTGLARDTRRASALLDRQAKATTELRALIRETSN